MDFKKRMKRSTYDRNRRRRKKRYYGAFEIIVTVIAIIMIACAYAGNIDPRSFFPAPFLVLAFIPIVILMLVLLLASMFWRRWLSMLIIFVSLVISLPTIKVFVPMNTVEDALPMPADTTLTLKVMTYNVLAFNYNEPTLNSKPSETMQLILKANPDVVVLQEGSAGGVHWKDMPSLQPLQSQIESRYPYIYYGEEGLNLLSKVPFTTQALGEPQHSRSPLGFNRGQTSYLARAFDLQLKTGKQLRLVDFRLQSYHLSFGKSMNVRVSPDVKPSAMERMRRSFALRGDDAATLRQIFDGSPANLIVCGDMNDVPTSHVYQVIRGDDLKDAWEDAGRGYAYTYNRHGLKYRIDHIFYRGDVRALRAQRFEGGSSDHYPLMVTFDIDNSTRK